MAKVSPKISHHHKISVISSPITEGVESYFTGTPSLRSLTPNQGIVLPGAVDFNSGYTSSQAGLSVISSNSDPTKVRRKTGVAKKDVWQESDSHAEDGYWNPKYLEDADDGMEDLKFSWLACVPKKQKKLTDKKLSKASFDRYEEAQNCIRLHIRRNALFDPELMTIPQELREEIQDDVKSRKSSVTKKIYNYFNMLYSEDAEIDLQL